MLIIFIAIDKSRGKCQCKTLAAGNSFVIDQLPLVFGFISDFFPAFTGNQLNLPKTVGY